METIAKVFEPQNLQFDPDDLRNEHLNSIEEDNKLNPPVEIDNGEQENNNYDNNENNENSDNNENNENNYENSNNQQEVDSQNLAQQNGEPKNEYEIEKIIDKEDIN